MSRPATIRRRLDALSLRMQARLDADWADRSLPWVLAAVLFALLFAMSLAVIRQLDGGPGLAVWTQTAWHLREGGQPLSSISGTDVIGSQWAFVAYPVLWLSRWISTPQLLAGTQALALALAVVPLWRLARTVFDLRVGTTAAAVGAYALAPAIHAVNLSLFHPEVIAIPAFAWAALFRRRKQWLPFAVCILVMLLSRADLGATVAAIGIVALLDGDRWAGIATTAAGALWTVAAIVLLDPQPLTGPLTAGQAFAAQGTAPLIELRRIFTDPTAVLGHLTGQQTVVVIIALFAPMLFLGMAAPRTLIPAVPAFVLGLAAGRAVEEVSESGVPLGSLGAGRVVVTVVPITVAGLVAVSRIGRRSVTRINVDHRLVGAMVAASVLFFVQYAPTSPYQQPWAWGGRDDVDRARMAVIESLGPTASVTVTPQLSAELSERSRVEETWLGPPDSETRWVPGTVAVILDTTAVGETDEPLWDDDDRESVTGLLQDQGYRLVSSTRGILFFRR